MPDKEREVSQSNIRIDHGAQWLIDNGLDFISLYRK